MSHFYGTLKGSGGEATRCGTKNSGIETHCASWEGAIRSYAYIRKFCKNCGYNEGMHGPGSWQIGCSKYKEIEIDWVIVERTKWQGSGKYRLLYSGPISGKPKPRLKIK